MDPGKLEEQYRELEEKFRTMVNSGNDGIVVLNQDYRVEFANQIASLATGFPMSELIGMDFMRLFNEENKRFMRQMFDKRQLGGDLRYCCELEIITYDGTIKDAEICITYTRDTKGETKIYAFLRDISERKRMEREIREATRKLQKISEMGDDGIFVFDENYRIEFVNTMASELTGYPRNKLIGMNFKALLSEEDQKFLANMHIELGKDENRRVCTEMEIIKVNDGRLDAEVCITLSKTDDGQIKTYAYVRDISERKKFQLKLKESEEKYRTLFERVPHGIFISSPGGKFLDCNQALVDMLGYDSKEELCQIDLATDLYVDPRQREDFKQAVEREGFVKDMEVKFKKKNGTKINILLTGHVKKDIHGNVINYEGLNVDITEKKKYEEKLRESEEKFRTLFERVRHGVYISSREGKFLDCNQALLDMLGYGSKEELFRIDLARDLYESPKDREAFQQQMEKDGFVKDLELVFKKKNGEKITVLLTGHTNTDKSGKVIGYQGLKEQLKELNVRYMELLGFATHELIQPLGVIKGFLNMMAEEALPPEKQKRAIFLMTRNTNMLINMSHKYLELAKLESGEIEVRKSSCNLFEEVVAPIIDDYTAKLTQMGMQVIIENEDEFRDVGIYADPLLLRIVYSNLISNAVRYGKPNGKIFMGCKIEEDHYKLHVKNDGTGVPRDRLSWIFEKFSRVESIKKKVKGAGMGLYNTREIIRRHGGEIWAESEEGEWADFVFTLPRLIRKVHDTVEVHQSIGA
ncbi:MAG: PAS domain S-box protein [Deltaproteobacteria bacterium]|nr:PAS domain S-box protein [Deltaproteobacteria bacterium]